jgi:hypothetical protein
MTRVFLAAGVAALAISAPAAAKPHNDRGGAQAQSQPRADRQAARADRQQMRVERQAPRMERMQMRAERPQRAERMQMRAERPQRQERIQMRVDRQAMRVDRHQGRQQVEARQVNRQQMRADRQAMRIDRHQGRQQIEARQVNRQQMRADRQAMRLDRQHGRQQAQARQFDRQQLRAERQAERQQMRVDRQAMQIDRQQLRAERQAERVALRADNVARVRAFAANRAAVAPLRVYGSSYIPVTTARSFIGVPLTTAASVVTFSALPREVQYLYPDTPDYYYRYGDGYLYRVDRTSNLIAALLPLLGGGYMPGSYLPNYYMSSYVPDYWGLNSFYPSSYSGYGYGYGGYNYDNMCNRYANGVIYRVDCVTGYVYDVIPTYAGGYGVGQLLPTDYSYYNVPYQYRSMYYDNDDYGYWYGPGAIYQYDRGSSMITSVAALLSPGFTVGQPLPVGYSTYNVPYAYRTTYYDTPNAWYRYNNGYIYQVDPTTQLVSAIVASILT